jgi:hypothetical protein
MMTMMISIHEAAGMLRPASESRNEVERERLRRVEEPFCARLRPIWFPLRDDATRTHRAAPAARFLVGRS